MHDIDQKLELYLTSVDKIIPGFDFKSSFAIYSGELPVSARITLSVSKAFKRLLSVKLNTCVIHYTSLQSMLSIVTSGKLRLYNCNNLNDRKEIEFANNRFDIGMKPEELQKFKQDYFVGSFCKYDPEVKNDDFNLWRLYGANGYGAALVFEIANVEDDWEDFFAGETIYGNENVVTDVFRQYISFHNDFNKKYKLFENTIETFPIISLFFKDPVWSMENEFRLFTTCPFDSYTFETNIWGSINSYLANTREYGLNESGGFVSYIQLPLNQRTALNDIEGRGLCTEDAKDLLSSIPHLSLKKVIIGYNVSSGVFNNVSRVLEHYGKDGEQPAIEYSGLRERL